MKIISVIGSPHGMKWTTGLVSLSYRFFGSALQGLSGVLENRPVCDKR